MGGDKRGGAASPPPGSQLLDPCPIKELHHRQAWQRAAGAYANDCKRDAEPAPSLNAPQSADIAQAGWRGRTSRLDPSFWIGITTTGGVNSATLSTTGAATVGGSLAVTGATTTNGLTNTGNLATTTLTTSGGATLGGPLSVTAGGASISGGINNKGGGITNAGTVTGVSPASLSATSTDAVNGGQLYQTNQNVQTIAQAVTTLIQTGACHLNGTSIVCGTGSQAASEAFAAGNNAQASGTNSVAVGSGALATYTGSVAIGAGARATADPTVAMGYNAVASGSNSTALGANSVASAPNSVALGQGSAVPSMPVLAPGKKWVGMAYGNFAGQISDRRALERQRGSIEFDYRHIAAGYQAAGGLRMVNVPAHVMTAPTP